MYLPLNEQLFSFLPFTLISWLKYPMYEIWIIAFSGTSSVYFPLKSVMVPIEVPFMRTLAPMIGSPFLSITVPVIPFFTLLGRWISIYLFSHQKDVLPFYLIDRVCILEDIGQNLRYSLVGGCNWDSSFKIHFFNVVNEKIVCLFSISSRILYVLALFSIKSIRIFLWANRS